MRLRCILGGFAAFFFAAQAATSARAETIDLSNIVASPNPRLGLAFPGSQTEYYPLMARAGLGVVRLSVSWARVEPEAGEFDWAGLDARVFALQSNGLEPFLTFESNADWATVPETQVVKNALPRNFLHWKRFVAAVVDRYDGDGRNDMRGLRQPVRFWQAANEWISDSNRSGGWAGSTEELIAYIRSAHDAVKSEQPDAVFVLGGVASFNIDVLLVALGGKDFTVRQEWADGSETVLIVQDMRGPEIAQIIDERIIPVLERSPYDIADVHLYGPEDRDPARIALIHRLSRRPVLSSECGGPSLDYGGSYTPEAHFHAVLRRNLGVLAAGAKFCLWFRLGEGPGATYGNTYTALYTSDAQMKPGVYAYRMLARLIDAETAVKHEQEDVYALRRADGEAIWIGWNQSPGSVRAFAAETGGRAYCLEDANAGRLTSELGDCNPSTMFLVGRNLETLLTP